MTQKRGLGRGLGALIPGAGSAPAPEQELRTRSTVRTRSDQEEQSVSERPVDMFFSGEEISEEARRQRDRGPRQDRSEEHTSELQSRGHLVCRLLLEKKKSGSGCASVPCDFGR